MNRKFTGIYKHEAYVWAAFAGVFLIPFFTSAMWWFRIGARIRWEFLTIAIAFFIMYHVAHIKYYAVKELRND